MALPELATAPTVMAYWSFGSEVPTGALVAVLHARGVRVILPRIEDGGLVPRAYVPGDPTTGTTFGAREPGAGAECVDPAAIDVVITPGLGFDRRGRRVGYGGGFYDRFFRTAAPDASRVGLAFAVQVLDDELPAGHADLPVHTVVTEREVIRCLERPRRT
jgi:5-formyltetrahydrofolate cyclo-ligase